jgi:hypothetical protein
MRLSNGYMRLIALALAATAGLALRPFAPGATPTPPPDGNCITCHEELYWVHDTGKWFCLCAENMSCTCCHGGDPEAAIADEAHVGMVVHPVGEQPPACAQCHANDTSQRIAAFATRAGVQYFHEGAAVPSAGAQVDTRAAAPPLADYRPSSSSGRRAALGVLAAAMVVLWCSVSMLRSDCLNLPTTRVRWRNP